MSLNENGLNFDTLVNLECLGSTYRCNIKPAVELKDVFSPGVIWLNWSPEESPVDRPHQTTRENTIRPKSSNSRKTGF